MRVLKYKFLRRKNRKNYCEKFYGRGRDRADMRRPQGGTHKGESPTRPFSGGTRHYFYF
jgi:hypothetical protein